MELKHVADGVYACMQEDKGTGYSNSGLVNLGIGLVVDTFFDLRHTREMIQQYERVWSHPAAQLVNTHHNGDHCWGNQLFRSAEIIGHRRCAEIMAKENPRAAGGGPRRRPGSVLGRSGGPPFGVRFR